MTNRKTLQAKDFLVIVEMPRTMVMVTMVIASSVVVVIAHPVALFVFLALVVMINDGSTDNSTGDDSTFAIFMTCICVSDIDRCRNRQSYRKRQEGFYEEIRHFHNRSFQRLTPAIKRIRGYLNTLIKG